jgi:hypothetical protein
MSKKDKLKERFRSKPKDFRYSELRSLLISIGYLESNRGGTSGSSVSFYNEIYQSLITLHKPHNPDLLKSYQIKAILAELETHNLI